MFNLMGRNGPFIALCLFTAFLALGVVVMIFEVLQVVVGLL